MIRHRVPEAKLCPKTLIGVTRVACNPCSSTRVSTGCKQPVPPGLSFKTIFRKEAKQSVPQSNGVRREHVHLR